MKKYLLDLVLVHTVQNPFPKVSLCYQQLFDKFNDTNQNQKIQISKFLDADQTPDLQQIGLAIQNNESIPGPIKQQGFNHEAFESQLLNIYNFNQGRIPNLECLLLFFPSYLDNYQNIVNLLLLGDGPLQIDERFMVAIMAVSVYGCDYLFLRLSRQFINYGGDPLWINEGLINLPKKFQNLAQLNIIIAYHPWQLEIRFDLIKKLQEEDGWEKHQLIYIMILMSFYHNLSAFCLANGLNHELDDHDLNLENIFQQNVQNIDLIDKNVKDKHTIERNKQQQEEEEEEDDQDIILFLKLDHKTSESSEKILNLLKNYQEEQLQPQDKSKSVTLLPDDQFSISDDGEQLSFYCKYVPDSLLFRIRDYDPHIYPISYNSMFQWELQAFSVIKQYYQDLADIIDQKFKLSMNMTSASFSGSQDVDTYPFRRAIQRYIMNIYGYQFQDYNYQDVNILLPRKYKEFLKRTTCNPGTINQKMIKIIPLNFQAYEICQSTIVALDAKQQISLMYCIKAVSKI